MKTSIRFSLLVILGALCGTVLQAQIVPLKIDVTAKPQLSPVMLMDGITEGLVVFAIDVDETGKLTDWLVLGYSHPALVDPCLQALKGWKITPARRNGQPVPVQTELTVNFSAEGVVISRTAATDVEAYMQRLFGIRRQTRRLAGTPDATPVRVTTVAPQYAKEAEQKGVRGKVQVHFYIDENGAVRMPAVEESPDPYLSEIAIAAVREWRFAPPTARGEPVMVAARQEFNFGK